MLAALSEATPKTTTNPKQKEESLMSTFASDPSENVEMPEMPLSYLPVTDESNPLEPPVTHDQPPVPQLPHDQLPVPQLPHIITSRPKEYGIGKPTPFEGDRTKVETFLQECLVYLTINKRIYDTDESKIGFMLSLLTDKEARDWKVLYVRKMIDETGELRFPAINQFIIELQEAFKMEDLTGTAMNKLTLLKQGKKTAEELVTEFRLLAGQAQLDTTTHSDNIHMIRLFRAALNPQLANKILFGDPVPGTIEGWLARAIHLDSNYRMAMAIAGKTAYRGNDRNQNRNWFKTNEMKDPNAMDVDAMMTDEKRASLMRQGLCFKCEERGHLARDCKKKKNSTPPQRKNVKDIHALLAALTEEEKDELVTLQKKDF